MFTFFRMIIIALLLNSFLIADVDTCPGNTLSNLNNATTLSSQSVSSSLGSQTAHYFSFTPSIGGLLSVDLRTYGRWGTQYNNSLFILTDNCSTYRVTDNLDNSSKTLSYSLHAGQQAIIAIYNRNRYSSISYDATFTFSPDTPPIMRDIPNQTANIGEAFPTLYISHYVTQTNGDPILSYKLLGSLPSGLSFDTSSGILSGTPIGTGTFNLSITATDKDGESNVDSFSITVTPGKPPIMNPIPNQTGTQNKAFTTLFVSNYVTQTNGDPILSYSLSGSLPSGLVFNETTGTLSGTPTQIGTFSLSVSATDKDGTSNAVSFLLTIEQFQITSIGGRNFELREQQSIFGDVKVIGNTVLCLKDNQGNCTESSTGVSNADVNLQKVSNSSSFLAIPEGSTITYARIYWQGRKAATDNNVSWDETSQNDAGKIELKKEDGTYTELTADIKDFSSTSVGTIYSPRYVRTYSASADASSVVTGGGRYYVNPSTFYTNTGKTSSLSPSDGLGNYGAWVLVVIYQNPNDTKARNITIFDGYKTVESDGENVNITANGFLTPKSGLVDSHTYVFAAEGDKYLEKNGDVIKMAGTTYNTTLQELGTFDSRIDIDTDPQRIPKLTNNNGIDIQQYNTGTTSGALGIITTNETGAKFQFTSDQDTYFPSLIVFSTELYLPKLCYDYSIKQDGQYLYIDRATNQIARIDSKVSTSDLDIGVYLVNQEADIKARGIAIKSDVNDTKFDMNNNISTSNVNGSVLIDRGAPSYSSTLCPYDPNGDNETTNNGCTNGHDIRKGLGTLDAGDYIYMNYTLTPQNLNGVISDVNETLGLSLKYYIIANGEKVIYPDYTLGSANVPLCEPTAQYTPRWGQFNVVESGSIKNNIGTQVAGKPFQTSVIFDSTPETGTNDAPISDLNTTVLVEVIDLDSYGDINASCANPASSLSTPIFVPLNFSPSKYQTQIPIQTNQYYNFAVKNAAYRIWYFTRANDILIQDWNASTSNSNKTLNSISGLYDSSVHLLCDRDCADPTSTGCFECIKGNYAKALCSRDNFSVRPESFNIHVFDINQTANATIQDATKKDLSVKFDYTPNFVTPLKPIRLATGYDYRFDVNATSHDSYVSATKGYTRYFTTSHAADYNASLIWNPPVGFDNTQCNDINSKIQDFYMANGQMINTHSKEAQVGEYKLNMFDKTWTSVDYDASKLTHHIAADGFDAGIMDCDISSTQTDPSGSNKVGCLISSDHNNTSAHHYYHDINIILKPYHFDIPTITFNSFRYIANVDDNDSNDMSTKYIGLIIPRGFDDISIPSNYVSGCYADDINITFKGNIEKRANSFKLRFIDYNSTNKVIDDFTRDINNSADNNFSDLNISRFHFRKDNNGTMDINISMNYERNISIAINPFKIEYQRVDVNCTNSSDCQINANLAQDWNITGSNDFTDINITYYYGRVHAPEYTFNVNPANARVYYEVYCKDCNRADYNLTDKNESVDSIYWYQNPLHVNNTFGEYNATFPFIQAQLGGLTPNATDLNTTTLTVTTTLPHTNRIILYPNSWLIYNPANSLATTSDFLVHFLSQGTWGGEGSVKEDNTVSTGRFVQKDNNITQVQRRLDW